MAADARMPLATLPGTAPKVPSTDHIRYELTALHDSRFHALLPRCVSLYISAAPFVSMRISQRESHSRQQPKVVLLILPCPRGAAGLTGREWAGCALVSLSFVAAAANTRADAEVCARVRLCLLFWRDRGAGLAVAGIHNILLRMACDILLV